MKSEKENKKQEYLSPGQKAWKRMRRNKSAMVGLFIIASAILIAIFAHIIIPDKTPNADDQVLELSTHQPGTEILFIQKHKNRPIKKVGFIKYLLNGRENPYEPIPINKYRIQGDQIYFERYTGTYIPDSIIEEKLSIVDVLYQLNPAAPDISVNDDKISFNQLDGKRTEKSLSALVKEIEQKNINKKSYLLGTDKFGRDLFSRLILGVRVSLSVGVLAVMISLLIGITMGSLAGYYRGIVDDVIMWIINVFWSIPLLLWVFALVLALGREFWQIFLAVGLVMWVEVARIVRGQFFSVREKEYVEAAQSLGFNDFRTIFRHILPNIVGPIIVITAANFASAIIIEAGLSFLGIGVQPPKASWGGMLHEYYKYIGTGKAYLAIIPGLAITLLTLGFNLVGNGLRDALDVKTKM